MPNPSADTIERRTLSTMWIVFCPHEGVITTEPYEENAYQRAHQLMHANKGKPVFVIEAATMHRVSSDGARRVYKIERDRLHIEQEML